jgi:hypothetical protein
MQPVQTDRAKELRAGIALLEMVGSTHDAATIDAMSQGKHMTGLMNQDLAAPFQKNFPVRLAPPLPVKSRVVTGKTEYPHTISQGGLTENEIPGRIRIEVFHGNGQKAESISGKQGL